MKIKTFDVLLVEDSQEDIDLTKEALMESKLTIDLSVVTNGEEALNFLNKEGKYVDAKRPDLILLDLNLPKKNGMEVLQSIKEAPKLKDIPIVIMTTSRSQEDVLKTYKLNANCYICKPLDFNKFIDVVKAVEDFWFTIVRLPRTNGE